MSLLTSLGSTPLRCATLLRQLPTFERTITSVTHAHTHHGSCHCGNIITTFHTSRSPAELGSRSCQCGWCRMQGRPSHTSDPAGQMIISAKHPEHIFGYRMGSGTAKFLGCTKCHVVPAITWRREKDGKLFGVLRVQTLDIQDKLMEHDRTMEVKEETLDDRLERRGKTWTPTVLAENLATLS